jgi:hypothetical protein
MSDLESIKAFSGIVKASRLSRGRKNDDMVSLFTVPTNMRTPAVS